MKILPLGVEHVEPAAEVLAAVHRELNGPDSGTSRPVPALADLDAARLAVRSTIESGPGVIAIDGSSAAGYMIAPLPKLPGPASVRLRTEHLAARPERARTAYRRMYEALAGRLVAAGCAYHSLPVPTAAVTAVETFFELEFGIDQIKGIREIVPSDHSDPGSTVVRTASVDDLERLTTLAIELTAYHSRSPMLAPALLDVPQIRRSLIRAIEDDASAVLVVDHGDGPVAMMEAEPDRAYAEDVLVIGMNVVTESARSAGWGTLMLDALLGWAAGRGYRHCTVGWTSSNLVSDAFYRSRGFSPIRYRLHRRIDSRVSWANGSLDYGLFPSE